MFAWESLRTEKGQPHSPSSHRHHLLLLEEKANRKQELHEQKHYPKCVLCWQHGSFCRNESSKGVQKRNKTTQNRTQPSDQEASLHKAGTCVCKDSLLLTSAKEENESWSRSSYFHCYQNRKWNEFCQSFTRFEQLQASTEDAHVHAGWSEGQTVESITVLMLTATWCYCQWK